MIDNELKPYFIDFEELKKIESPHLAEIKTELGLDAYEQKISVAKLKNVMVTHQGVYLPSHGKFVYESSLASLLKQKKAEVSEFMKRSNVWPECELEKKIEPVYSISECVFLGLPWDVNYQHFFVESLPKAYVMKQYCTFESVLPKLLLTPNRFSVEFLERLGGYDKKPIYIEDIGEQSFCVQVDTLHICSPVNVNMWKFKNPYLRDAVNHILSSVSDKKEGPSKVYLSRKNSAQNNGSSRTVINESAISNLLVSNGYSVEYFEELTFEEKCKVLSKAESIVSPIGAGLINLAFAKSLKKLTLFKHEYLNLPSNWFQHYLSYLKGRDIECVSIETQISSSDKGSKHAPYTVDELELKNIVEEL